ncbi:glycosyltransferase involved in cell wall biosynthesis [Pedobacter sp. W3I1]|uniref:glycosyltransferase family 2 protein n=1 Tax=Pedobacter sp. W3I1 TaxID=3042291 RepID=UPI00277ED204|nr:glycosyltransferase family 2 protein [Pedobacter sp. W3I1]MDQ0640903.1 glycosyltransferase involved in cell wall biosynthesis [Pedobacter sp. W3I1]
MNSKIPKISIITPTFNQGQFIEQTIISVLNQNYENLEYIIIDGGSTDNTLDIIKKYGDKLTYWISEPDFGQTDAINKGYKIATGDIINWLNSDDYLHKNALKNISNSFLKHDVLAVTSIVNNFDNNGSWEEVTPFFSEKQDYIAKGFNNQPGTFFKKEIWDFFSPLPNQLHFTMDQYIWFCFWLTQDASAFKIENYTSVYFRRHENSKTSRSIKKELFNHLGPNFFDEHNLIFWSFFKNISEVKAKLLEQYFSKDFDFNSKEIKFNKGMQIKGVNTSSMFDQYLFVLLKEDFRTRNIRRFKKSLDFLKKNAGSSIQPELYKLEKRRYYLLPLKGFDCLERLYRKLKMTIGAILNSKRS